MNGKNETIAMDAGNIENERSRGRKKITRFGETEKKYRMPLMIAAAVVLAAGGTGGFYLAMAHTYQEAFLPNTSINGIDASRKTVDEVKAEIEAELSSYELKIIDRTGAGETIKREEIDLRPEFDGSLEKILTEQEPMRWIKALGTSSEHEIRTMIMYDEEKLEETILSLSIMEEERMEAPKNAEISEYDSDTKRYTIIPAEEGTTLVKKKVIPVIVNAIQNLQTEVDLDAEACYTRAEIETEDKNLRAMAEELNTYVGSEITYTFGTENEVLDGDTIHTWLTIADNQVVVDETLAADYVRQLAKTHNTAYGDRKVKTSYGDIITISGGSYGWRINETAETEAVLEIVKNGEQQTREPEYQQKAACYGEYDYGDTYVELNLTAQHLFFYKDGELLVESDFVSGSVSRGWATPAGSYPLTYKQRNAVLRGANYATPVSYWMPFNGGIGLHDANWRSSFGGTIYKTNGSHGCINLPPSVAKVIFENISAGDPVLCYHLDGTASTTTSKPAQTVPAATAAPETTSAPTEPETTAEPETSAEESTEAPTETTTTTEAISETAGEETSQVTPETADMSVGPGGGYQATEGYGPGYANSNEEMTEYGPGN